MKTKFFNALSLAVIMAMLITSLALADNVKNDVVSGGNDTITTGSSTTIYYWIQATGGNGCDASVSSPAIVTLTIPGTVTASSTQLKFTACNTSDEGHPNNTQSVTFSSSTEGNYVINATATGYNDSPADFTLHVLAPPPPPSDTTPPVISYTLNPAFPDGDNGWYVGNVTLAWNVSEPESPGSLILTGCVDQSITADQIATDYTCSATSDGGSAGPVTVSIKRDATAPSVSLIGGPASLGSYYFGFVPPAPTCSASDATSGLNGDCNVSGYGTSVGGHTVSASAFDFAGNQGSASVTYTVLAWTLSGFYQPVDMTPTGSSIVWNTVKNGSTVPLKFEVFAGSTELTDPAIVNQPLSAIGVACESGTAAAIELTSTGGTSLRYDNTAGQFIYNWKTPNFAGACYQVTVSTADGSSISAYFKLK